MSLLHDIQESVIDDKSSISPILLKVRLLAARLQSNVLETWVKHESEGYPTDAELPDYRILPVHYSGSFAGPFGSGVNNAQIPSYLIQHFAGEDWLTSKTRSSVAEIENLLGSASKSGTFQMSNSANLILLLNGKVFPEYSCMEVQGHVGKSQMSAILNSVRSKVLDLVIKIENELPQAADIGVGKPEKAVSKSDSDKISNISNSVIYSIHNTGASASIQLNVGVGKIDDFEKALVDAGIAQADAKELASIIKSEEPTGPTEPLGEKAQNWLIKNLSKAVSGVWKASTTVATTVITEAAIKYYGLK